MSGLTHVRAVTRWLRAQGPRPPVGYLVAIVNTRCEQDCVQCFVRPEADDDLLQPADYTATGRHLGGLLQLTITGGEPTLRADLSEVVAGLVQPRRVPYVSLHTNGFGPERVERQVRAVLAKIPDSLLSVRLSLDGPLTLHDEIRRRPGSWDRAMESLARLASLRRREPRLHLFVDTVVSAHNQGRLGELASILDRMPVDGRELLFLRGDPRDPGALPDGAEPYLESLDQFVPDLASGGRGDVAFSLPEAARGEVYRRVIAGAQGGAARNCFAGSRFAILGPTGDVLPCEMPASGGAVGNVRRHGPNLGRILAGRAGRASRERIRAGDCAKGCTYECAALASVALSGPDLGRALWRRWVGGRPKRESPEIVPAPNLPGAYPS